MQQSHQVKTAKTAHYSTMGKAGKQVKYCWIACHGYGQLAKYFIRKFDVIEQPDTFVIAPEGFSRFYWQGFTGNVVATWMTREDRLVEIEDYSNYLSQLYDFYIPQLAPDVKIILLGFSQGCATQIRWMCRKFPAFQHLILWGGLLPEDIVYTPHLSYFEQGHHHLVYGTRDIYLTEERIQQQQGIEQQYSLNFQRTVFEGSHEIDRKTLAVLNAQVRLCE